ncbi:DUF6702 family protein [Sphingobacterium sp. HJSM2_6]|uniref:DUF6702 family protein n=1 Tax=Sphingobacterium sp. HJSM2_6 TaxID=3366264 RepID=UPI003BD0A3A1
MAHPFYVSITQIDFNQGKQQLEFSTSIFFDDLEIALQNHFKKKINVIKPIHKAEVDSIISSYYKQQVKVRINGQVQKLQYVGYEIDNDVAWCYFKISAVKQIQKLEVVNQLLYQDFKTQTNIIHATVNKERKSQKLDNPKRIVEFNF